MKKYQPFSLVARAKSFGYAFSGIKTFFKTEHNAILHMAGTAAVMLLSVLLHISTIEAAILAIAVGMVWAAELFNTCIEKIMDMVSTERKPQIKFIKDLSAAAVLVTALAAAIAGLFVFIPKL
jgi:diacylglycerol kinase (ATP)